MNASMSAQDVESLEATRELLGDAEALRRVEQARQDLDAGRGTSADQMAELMEARRKWWCCAPTPRSTGTR